MCCIWDGIFGIWDDIFGICDVIFGTWYDVFGIFTVYLVFRTVFLLYGILCFAFGIRYLRLVRYGWHDSFGKYIGLGMVYIVCSFEPYMVQGVCPFGP